LCNSNILPLPLLQLLLLDFSCSLWQHWLLLLLLLLLLSRLSQRPQQQLKPLGPWAPGLYGEREVQVAGRHLAGHTPGHANTTEDKPSSSTEHH
jgi:hypothetical protein